jgi:hypothetical protein
MLYENTSVDVDSDKRFHVELHFSPGAFADFDAPAYLSKPNEEIVSDNSSLLNTTASSDSKEKHSPVQSSSPHNQTKLINYYLNRNIAKRFPNKKITNELQTLPEPNNNGNDSIDDSLNIGNSKFDFSGFFNTFNFKSILKIIY